MHCMSRTLVVIACHLRVLWPETRSSKKRFTMTLFFPTEAINYVTYNAEQFKKTTTVCLFKFQSLIKILTVNLLIQSYSFHRIPLFSRCTNLCQLREILSFGCFILTNLVYLGLIGREMIFLLALGSSLISVRSSIFM